MNALAVKPETFSSDDESFEAIVNDLSPNIVRHFKSTGLPEKTLIDFVYALDAIAELSNTPGFPTDRMLTTNDLINGGWPVVWAFINKAKADGIIHNYGVAVSQTILDQIESFFNDGYLVPLYDLLKTTDQQKLMFVLDSTSLAVSINRITPHPEYGVIHYVDLTNHKSIQIPFRLDRILNA